MDGPPNCAPGEEACLTGHQLVGLAVCFFLGLSLRSLTLFLVYSRVCLSIYCRRLRNPITRLQQSQATWLLFPLCLSVTSRRVCLVSNIIRRLPRPGERLNRPLDSTRSLLRGDRLYHTRYLPVPGRNKQRNGDPRH